MPQKNLVHRIPREEPSCPGEGFDSKNDRSNQKRTFVFTEKNCFSLFSVAESLDVIVLDRLKATTWGFRSGTKSPNHKVPAIAPQFIQYFDYFHTNLQHMWFVFTVQDFAVSLL